MVVVVVATTATILYFTSHTKKKNENILVYSHTHTYVHTYGREKKERKTRRERERARERERQKDVRFSTSSSSSSLRLFFLDQLIRQTSLVLLDLNHSTSIVIDSVRLYLMFDPPLIKRRRRQEQQQWCENFVKSSVQPQLSPHRIRMKIFNQPVVLNRHPTKHFISNTAHQRSTNSYSQVDNKEFFSSPSLSSSNVFFFFFAYFSLNRDYWSRTRFERFLHCHSFLFFFSLIVLLFVYSLERNASNNSRRKNWFKARLNYRTRIFLTSAFRHILS